MKMKYSRKFLNCSCLSGNCIHFDEKLCDPDFDDYEESSIRVFGNPYVIKGHGYIDVKDGEVVPDDVNRCRCGCGAIIPKGRKFVMGHNARVNNNMKVNKEI